MATNRLQKSYEQNYWQPVRWLHIKDMRLPIKNESLNDTRLSMLLTNQKGKYPCKNQQLAIGQVNHLADSMVSVSTTSSNGCDWKKKYWMASGKREI